MYIMHVVALCDCGRGLTFRRCAGYAASLAIHRGRLCCRMDYHLFDGLEAVPI